jgi:hypothetical protein
MADLPVQWLRTSNKLHNRNSNMRMAANLALQLLLARI